MIGVSTSIPDRDVAPDVGGSGRQAQNDRANDFEQHLGVSAQAPSGQEPNLADRIVEFEGKAPRYDRATFETERNRLQNAIEDVSDQTGMGSQEYDELYKKLAAVAMPGVQDMRWDRPIMQRPLSAAQEHQAEQVRQQFATMDPDDRDQHEQIHQSAIQAYQHPDASPGSIITAYEKDRAAEKFAHDHPIGFSGALERVSNTLKRNGPTGKAIQRVLDATRRTPNGSTAAAALKQHQATIYSYQRRRTDMDIAAALDAHHVQSRRAVEQRHPDPT